MAMTFVYNRLATITPSDATAIPQGLTDAIYVGGAGQVAVVQQDGTVQNMTAPAGATLPVRALRVNSTNTTATLLVALYQV